jgi:hypothetical protein
MTVACLDVVELIAGVGRWPAGRIGTVLEVAGEQALVEMADEVGRTLDLVIVPFGLLRLRPLAEQYSLRRSS